MWRSVHPAISEYCEPLGFREEAEAFVSREGGGFDDLARITCRPVRCCGQPGQPGQAWAPQAELFSVFRQVALGSEEAVAEVVYGPESDFKEPQAMTVLRVGDILEAIAAPLPEVCGFPQLPDFFEVGGVKLCPATMTCTLAAIIRGSLGPNEWITPIQGTLLSVKHSSSSGEWAKYWCIFREDLEVPNIIGHSGRQTWTIKPAVFGVPATMEGLH